ncbi:MAG: ribonucleoside-diphosphate reductase subunit alpha [Microcystis sp. M20BS1]|uniref:ribonucleotide reductase N-terminal alpha domain-containing protein n=1 Tax=Microcystis sp. M20BS1 TaxID=2771181 RepID=UPI00257AEE53|nr:ribonucleotide reductase N-terminal alpha domain-containing protein [Microcystis sp. M20BS1]MCA2631155.1 ribonucleoside-diphosphate reductase subunit alpha [Microcystis sp. M20BS1]
MQINVIHTDGTRTPYDANRAIEVINWACEGLEVDPDKLSRRLSRRFNDDTTTEAIQNGLIRSAAELADLHYPDWLKVSGRLRMWDWRRKVKARRGYLYGNYPVAFEYLRSEGLYEGDLINKFLDTYSADDIAEAGTWIDPERDMRFDISGADLLTARYLLEGELLQEMWLTQALLLSMLEPAHERMTFAHKAYDLLSLGKISLATPLMSNLRQADGSLSSCHIIDIDDSRESIFDNISQLAAMSANGGGVGVRISKVRARGSRIRKKKGASGGVCPWIKIINATIVATNQRGVRAGACTVGIDVWHADLLEYMDLRGDAGSEHTKARDILLQFIISDEFMRRVILDKDWYLVCPTEIKNVFGYQLANMYGDEFTNAYHAIETYINSSAPPLEVVKKVSAKAIWKKMLMLLLETGTPYVAFKDRINALNPNKHEGIIGGVNLCVAPETLLMTDRGHLPIATLAGQVVNAWNGTEWSEVTVRQTGENQPLLQVHFSNGETLDCTYYHKFHVQRRNGRIDIVEARDLDIGDKLINFDLPVLSSDSDVDLLTSKLGDGKEELLSYIGGGSTLRSPRVVVYDYVKQACQKPSLYWPDELTVPINGYTVQSRLEWLARLLDSDGTYNSFQTFRITHTSKPFLLQVRLMLQTLGVDSKVFPRYKVGLRAYRQEKFHLLIDRYGVYQLSQLGLRTNRLQWMAIKPKYDSTSDITIKEVELTGRRDNTYCAHEPKRNLLMFNGVITGNCVESYSLFNSSYSHCCMLLSLVLPRIADDEMADVSRMAVRLLDAACDLTTSPTYEARAHVKRYRTIGVGVMGLADWLAIRHLKYQDLDVIEKLFEDICFYTTQASVELAEERGAYPAFPGSEWSKGLILGGRDKEWVRDNSTNPERWYALMERLVVSGIRNSHILATAPNSSTSLVQGTTASFLPVFSRLTIDKNGAGINTIVPLYIKEAFHFYQESRHTHPSVVVSAAAVIQKWIDTGLSTELLFNFNEHAYGLDSVITAKDLNDVYLQAWREGLKTVYYVRSIWQDKVTEKSECHSCAS